MTKTCTNCGNKKPLEEFYKFCRAKDGLAYECKICSKERAKNYAKAHRTERSAKHLEWAEKNREHLRTYMREYMREYSKSNKRKENAIVIVESVTIERPAEQIDIKVAV